MAIPPPDSSPTSPVQPSSPFAHRPARGPSTSTSRRLGPNRRHSRLSRLNRIQLHVRRDQLHADLATLDGSLQELTASRLALLAELGELRERLWPVVPGKRGRRPPAVDQASLAAISPDAEPLWGDGLRWVALGLLERHGRTSLRDLHDLIHRYGYCIDSRTPVKALADALGHEADVGRARRVARGVYELAGRIPLPPPRPPLVDPDGPAVRRDAHGPVGAADALDDGPRMSDAQAEAILASFRAAQTARATCGPTTAEAPQREAPSPAVAPPEAVPPLDPPPLGPPPPPPLDPGVAREPSAELAPRSRPVQPGWGAAQPSLRTVLGVTDEIDVGPPPKEGIP